MSTIFLLLHNVGNSPSSMSTRAILSVTVWGLFLTGQAPINSFYVGVLRRADNTRGKGVYIEKILYRVTNKCNEQSERVRVCE